MVKATCWPEMGLTVGIIPVIGEESVIEFGGAVALEIGSSEIVGGVDIGNPVGEIVVDLGLAAIGWDGSTISIGQVGVGIRSVVEGISSSITHWSDSALADQVEDFIEPESIEGHNDEIGEESSSSGDFTHLTIGMGQKSG